jgi:hypothetical protein
MQGNSTAQKNKVSDRRKPSKTANFIPGGNPLQAAVESFQNIRRETLFRGFFVAGRTKCPFCSWFGIKYGRSFLDINDAES